MLNSINGISDINNNLKNTVIAINTLNQTISTVFPEPYTSSATYDPPNLLTLTTTSTTITVTGATLGARVDISFSLDLQGIVLTAYVSAANTVTVVFFNPTVGAINLASGTLKAWVYRT